jgi:hypothetical protein
MAREEETLFDELGGRRLESLDVNLGGGVPFREGAA